MGGVPSHQANLQATKLQHQPLGMGLIMVCEYGLDVIS